MQVLTAEIVSLYQKQGTDQASQAFKDLQGDAAATSRTFGNLSVSANNAIAKIGQPISRVGLTTITRDLAYTTGAFDNLGRGAGSLVSGLGSLVGAFTPLLGTLGLVVSIGAIVALVFAKIRTASLNAADGVKKQADALADLYVKTEDAIRAGTKYGTLTKEQADRLRGENKERSAKLDRMRDEKQRLETLIEARLRELEASKVSEDAARKEVARLEKIGASEEKVGSAKAAVLFAYERERSINEQLNKLQERRARLDQELLGLSTARAAVREKANEGENLYAEIQRQQELLLFQRAAATLSLQDAEDQLIDKRAELFEAENLYLELSATSDQKAVDAASRRIELVNAEIEALTRRADTLRASYAKEQALNVKRAAQFRALSNVIAAGFENADKRILFSWRSVMAATVEAAATAISTHLLMKAAENFKNPIAAAAYIAAAGVVQGLGSAAAGAIRAGAPGAGGTDVGAAGAGAGAAAPTTEERTVTTTINVSVQGDYIGEPAFIDRLAERLSERVQTGGVVLNASTARNLAPAVGPAT